MQALALDERDVSFLRPIGYQAEDCGYCKDAPSGRRTKQSRACYYALSKKLTVDDYQELVDRGWRRSGTTLYKPDVRRHCCPHYTIRLPASSFKATRDQRQAVNRWNKYVLGEDYIKEAAKKYPKTKEEKARQKNGFDLLSTIHEAESTVIKSPPEPAHKFEVTLEPDSFSKEKYLLFKNYQINVHHEKPSEVTEKGFKRFLCDSPLQRTTRRLLEGSEEQPLGSYHQCYRLDGRLIAMGVLDLLPHCVSGVYFVYHSDFEQWSFGKLSALREAALALEAGYKYYYMGYYIHDCVKMRYKGHYKPQHVLDPETYEWVPLDGEFASLLDQKSYVSLAQKKGLKKETPEAEAEKLDEDADPFPLPLPADAAAAVAAGTSLFDLKVPGLMTEEEIAETVDLDKISLQVQRRIIPMGVCTPSSSTASPLAQKKELIRVVVS
ncbi:uncharacterized protein BDZ99DRAFT_463584 [Mytilinidion resinicola]|uniref:arginyltransferase n=1 Tax=Mytilinidion resinicola TaxID=574789 RepID=A0A6A6YL33_9PEZI|nr:uncharacterized protein BDZ99DRAFT_463584 [Mytilinidion resinicola]KAF2808685.1 hypothetical protein BDZ99DRAFT_463584 [Mytilinidion resinicola]